LGWGLPDPYQLAPGRAGGGFPAESRVYRIRLPGAVTVRDGPRAFLNSPEGSWRFEVGGRNKKVEVKFERAGEGQRFEVGGDRERLRLSGLGQGWRFEVRGWRRSKRGLG